MKKIWILGAVLLFAGAVGAVSAETEMRGGPISRSEWYGTPCERACDPVFGRGCDAYGDCPACRDGKFCREHREGREYRMNRHRYGKRRNYRADRGRGCCRYEEVRRSENRSSRCPYRD